MTEADDYGNRIQPWGAPNSLVRMRARRPKLLKELEEIKRDYKSLAPYNEEFPLYILINWLAENYHEIPGWEVKLIAEDFGFDPDEAHTARRLTRNYILILPNNSS